MDTASRALAPRRDLFSVPSRSMRVLSMKACSSASRPIMDSEISVFTFSTAWSTPLPRERAASPSRNSMASREPVEAPEGTAARPITPDSSRTSASTVGLPRESRISRATTSTIALISILSKKPTKLEDAANRPSSTFQIDETQLHSTLETGQQGQMIGMLEIGLQLLASGKVRHQGVIGRQSIRRHVRSMLPALNTGHPVSQFRQGTRQLSANTGRLVPRYPEQHQVTDHKVS